MAQVDTIVVGGGIASGSPFTVDAVPYISSIDPPTLASTDFFSVVNSGVNRGVIVGASDPGAGPERLRVNGGCILRGSHASTTVIGDGVVSGGIEQIAIGESITPGAQPGVLIGVTVTNGTGGGPNVVIGNGSSLVGAGTVIRGTSAAAGGANIHTVINGSSTGGTNANHTNIGGTCNITTGVTCVGMSATVGSSCTNSVVVGGASTHNGGPGCVAVGAGTSINNTSYNNCVVIGNGAQAWQTRMVSIGSNASLEGITMMCVGHGLDVVANPSSLLFRLTNASGTNNTGGTLTLQAGLSTGNIVGNGVNLDGGVPTGSGTTLQVSRTYVAARPTTTATQTGLMVWDVDNATLERVTVGAADSGGVGFKVLRIPN